jgi:hypothetical protein
VTAADLIAAAPDWYATLVARMAPTARYGRDGDRLVVTR